jgi:hypothetical protein
MTRSENLNPNIEEIITDPDRAEAYYRLASLYMQGPDEIREQIRQGWDFGLDWIYPNPTKLACSKNESHSCYEKILASLVYNSINDLRVRDLRDELIDIAITYHSCLAAGFDPREIFEKVASVSSLKTAQFLRDFINREPEDKSLEAFMLTKQKNVDGEFEVNCAFYS